jgi:hypothetical protein
LRELGYDLAYQRQLVHVVVAVEVNRWPPRQALQALHLGSDLVTQRRA